MCSDTFSATLIKAIALAAGFDAEGGGRNLRFTITTSRSCPVRTDDLDVVRLLRRFLDAPDRFLAALLDDPDD